MQERQDFAPAILPSEGLGGRRATLHVFSHTGTITIKHPGGNSTKGIGHFYRCTETGSIRQWGFETTWGKDTSAPKDN